MKKHVTIDSKEPIKSPLWSTTSRETESILWAIASHSRAAADQAAKPVDSSRENLIRLGIIKEKK